MSLKDKPGIYFTTEGMIDKLGDKGENYYLLVSPNQKHVWTNWSLKELNIHKNSGWDFIDGVDDHLIRGAVLVAPFPILFWSE